MYLIKFPFHPDRFNPDSVEHRALLVAAFKEAKIAAPVTEGATDDYLGLCVKGADGWYTPGQGAELFVVDGK